MKIASLINQIDPLRIVGNRKIEITSVETDSRQVKEGSLFIAVRGTQVDGHRFIADALGKGAVAILCEEIPEEIGAELTEGKCFVMVKESKAVVGLVATAFYGHPSTRMKLVGVTGTNGKTTIATLLYRLFRLFGHKVGLISTVCNFVDGRAIPTDHTTPDPITLNRLLGEMADEGCEYAFMEVSSHSVVQHRIGGLMFAGGIFTNLTRDHLDYHKTFEAYLKAKKGFFDMLPEGAFCLTNRDDRNGEVMAQNTKAKVATYSLRSAADFKAHVLESHFEGMLLEMDGQEVAVHFIGRFNASNLLAVYGAARLLGKPKMETLCHLSKLYPVDGRFEAIRSPKGFTAIVDYAHTPDALVNVLTAIDGVLQGKGRIITVVGAGGNRDKGKRPIMAREAAGRSDLLILTSDNPRYEEPQDILKDMAAGVDGEAMKKTLTITERREAIRTACLMAQPGDVVLVAGKGHETYQDVKGVKHHFDDREELRSAMGLTENSTSSTENL